MLTTCILMHGLLNPPEVSKGVQVSQRAHAWLLQLPMSWVANTGSQNVYTSDMKEVALASIFDSSVAKTIAIIACTLVSHTLYMRKMPQCTLTFICNVICDMDTLLAQSTGAHGVCLLMINMFCLLTMTRLLVLIYYMSCNEINAYTLTHCKTRTFIRAPRCIYVQWCVARSARRKFTKDSHVGL